MNFFVLGVRLCVFVLAVSGQDKSNWVGCYSPQYLVFGTKGVIQCRFPEDFIAVYWYDNVTSTNAKPVLTYQDSEKKGYGYENREFDIETTGSLIIANTSLAHEKTFKAIYFEDDELFGQFLVYVIVTVYPTQKIANISGCQNLQSPCYIKKLKSSHLLCSFDGARPASLVDWFIQAGYQKLRLNSSTEITQNEDNTFVTIANLSLSDIKNNVVYTLFCGWSPRHTSDWKYVSVIVDVFQDTLLSMSSPKPAYFSVNGIGRLSCSLKFAETVVWKRIFKTGSENIAFVSRSVSHVLNNFKNQFQVSSDNSLIIQSVQLNYEGNYSCIASNLKNENVSFFHVVMIVPPVPSYISISGCPSLEQCAIQSTEEGVLTCRVSGVRPQVELTWWTEDETIVHFKKQEISVRESSGLFYISAKLFYTIRTSLPCRKIVTLRCTANGVASDVFLSSREIIIKKDNCTEDGAEVQNTQDEKDGPPKLILGLFSCLLLVFIGIVSIFLIYYMCFKNKRRHLKDDDEGRIPLNETNQKFNILIKGLKNIYEVRLAAFTMGQDFSSNRVYVPNHIRVDTNEKISSQDDQSCLLNSYEELITHQGVKDKTILIEGVPGQGKTSLVMQIIEDWITTRKHSEVQRFDILLMISLQQMKKGQNFFEYISKNMTEEESNLSSADVEEILNGEKRCLIVFDNFEQYPERMDETSALHKIMNQEVMPEAKVVLMTRPTVHSKTFGEKVVFTKLENFNQSQLDQYVTLFFRENYNLCLTLKRKIQEDENLQERCQIPLYLYMTALMLKQGKSLEASCERLTTFFEFLVEFFNTRRFKKQEHRHWTKFNINNHFPGVAKIALEGLINQTYSFEKEHLSREMKENESILDTGLFTECDKTLVRHQNILESPIYLQFIHELYQDFYAALYLAIHASLKDFGEHLSCLDVHNCRQMVVFTCGLTKDGQKVQKIVDHLLMQEDRYPHSLTNCIVMCFHETNIKDWNGRDEQLGKLFQKEYGSRIVDNESRILQKAKISLINTCSQQREIKMLSLNGIITGLRGSTILMDCGATLNFPRFIRSCFISDFKGVLKDVDIMTLIESTTSIKEMLIYSSLKPFLCSKKGMEKISDNDIDVCWITFENSKVVTFSIPSPTFLVWMNCLEIFTINHLERVKKIASPSKNAILFDMKKQPNDEFGQVGKNLTTTEKEQLQSHVQKCIEIAEKVLNEWRWAYEAKTDHDEKLHEEEFAKYVTELGQKFERWTAASVTEDAPKSKMTETEMQVEDKSSESRLRDMTRNVAQFARKYRI